MKKFELILPGYEGTDRGLDEPRLKNTYPLGLGRASDGCECCLRCSTFVLLSTARPADTSQANRAHDGDRSRLVWYLAAGRISDHRALVFIAFCRFEVFH